MSKSLLKKYCDAIKAFEDRKKSYKTPNVKYKGHLINKSKYEELKKKVDYNNYKGVAPKSVIIEDNDKIMKIKDIDIKSYSYLNNMIINGNEYILIDESFWTIVKDKKDSLGTTFEYKIDSSMLIIYFEHGKELKFKININNALNSNTLLTKNENDFKDIKKIYNSIKEYYEFENKVKSELKNPNPENKSSKGFLVENELLDSWIKTIKYETIKNDYISSNKSEKKTIDKIIYYIEKKEAKFMDLTTLKNDMINTKSKLEEYLKSKSIALLSENFIKTFSNNPNLKKIEYKILKNKIEIIFDSSNTITLDAKDNIISNKSTSATEEKDQIEHEVLNKNSEENVNKDNLTNNNFFDDVISILISIFLFEKEFLEKAESSKKMNNNSCKNYSLINEKIFDEFKRYFSYEDEIKKIIEENSIKSISSLTSNLLKKIRENHTEYCNKVSELKEGFLNKFSAEKIFQILTDKKTDFNINKTNYFPKEFQIIDVDISKKISELLGEKKNLFEEVRLGFNLGNVIIQYKKDNSNYINIFSISLDSKGHIDYIPEIGINFKSNVDSLNKFINIIKDETLIENCFKKIEKINITYDCNDINFLIKIKILFHF